MQVSDQRHTFANSRLIRAAISAESQACLRISLPRTQTRGSGPLPAHSRRGAGVGCASLNPPWILHMRFSRYDFHLVRRDHSPIPRPAEYAPAHAPARPHDRLSVEQSPFAGLCRERIDSKVGVRNPGDIDPRHQRTFVGQERLMLISESERNDETDTGGKKGLKR